MTEQRRPTGHEDNGPGSDPGERESDRSTPEPPPLRPGRRGRGTRAVDAERPCMNCGDPTPGEYCPSCGQRKVVVQVSVRTLVMDVLEDQFILDKRLPRTLQSLLFRPGHMTVEHVNGRIVRYVHPFRLYLVTSLIFFLLLSFLSQELVRRATADDDAGNGSVAAIGDSPDRELASLDSALARIDRQIADTSHPEALRSTLEGTRQELVERRTALLASQDSPPVPPASPTEDTTTRGAATDTAGGSAADEARGEPAADTAATDPAPTGAGAGSPRGPPTIGQQMGWNDDPPTINVPGPPVVDSAIAGRIRRLGSMTQREAGETLVRTFFNYAPTLMFILLPVFAGVLKLLYIRRGRFYAEHFVFLLHVHSFVFLLATIMLVAGRWVGNWLELALGVWMVVYIFLAMKRVYGQGWMKTFAKFWTLGWMYFWILTFAIPFAFVAALLFF